jgi:hypothetical protein
MGAVVIGWFALVALPSFLDDLLPAFVDWSGEPSAGGVSP